MNRIALAAALAATSLIAAPAFAQSADTKEDMRCALVAMAAAEDDEEA